LGALFGRGATLSKKLAVSVSFIYIQYKSLRFAHFFKSPIRSRHSSSSYIYNYLSYEPATLSSYVVVEVAKHAHVRFSYWKTGSYIIFCSMIQFTVLEGTYTIVHRKSINQTFCCTIKLFVPLSSLCPKILGEL
jgi:hypothetical protein